MGTREQVCSMRHGGIRGAEIARVLGVSKQRVSQICKEEAIAGAPPPPLRLCERCGAETGFGPRWKLRFCSRDCRYANIRGHGREWARMGRPMRLGPEIFRLRRAGLTWAEIAAQLGIAKACIVTGIARRYAKYTGADTKGVIAEPGEPPVYNRTTKPIPAQAGA